MTATAREIVSAFDALPAAEGDAVLAELLLRRPAGDKDIPVEAFEELAEDLFLSYDAAEGADAAPAH